MRNLGLYRLKGIACVAVFSRHILDAFLWNQTLNNPSFDYFFNLPIVWNICSSGGVSVCIFCLISGYLAACTRIDDIGALIKRTLYRWFSLFTLMLLCDIVMVLMKKVGMFSYVGTAAEILGNKKYADFNAFTLIKGLKLPLMLRSYNGAMWMIQFLYIGNILTYTIKWIQHRIKGMRFAVVYLVVSVMAYLYDPLVFVTFIGNAGYFYRDYFTKVKSKNPEMSFFSTLGLMYLAQKAPAFSSVIPYYICESIVCGLLCLCSVQLLESITLLKKMIDFLGKYNMVIYSIHIPIIYSLGAFIFCTFYRYGFEAAFVSTYIVCLIAFLVIAIPYNIFIENNRLSLLSRFKGVLRI